MTGDYPRILIAGDSAVTVVFGNAINPEINDLVHGFCAAIEDAHIPGIIELVPTYCSVLVCYNPAVIRYAPLVRRLRKIAARGQTAASTGRRVFEIPVCYGGEFGEDLEDVASLAGISAAEVIKRHSAPEYRIYMLGFLPGFAYLGGLDKSIATPRLATPRVKIPAGAVGIGGEQTGIYPLDSPGGWRLIGRTPLKPYDAHRNPAILYRAGDFVRFSPIDEAEYRRLEQGDSVAREVRK
jgi:KipI family sensor histidine kinase inhibitor